MQAFPLKLWVHLEDDNALDEAWAWIFHFAYTLNKPIPTEEQPKKFTKTGEPIFLNFKFFHFLTLIPSWLAIQMREKIGAQATSS